jgi:hypothetical protein
MRGLNELILTIDLRWGGGSCEATDGGACNFEGPSTTRYASGSPPHRKSMGRI